MKEEKQTGNWQQLKDDDRENKKIETSSQKNKLKEVTLEKNKGERNIGETKLQNITKSQNIRKGDEKEVCMVCNKYAETGMQCGICYR